MKASIFLGQFLFSLVILSSLSFEVSAKDADLEKSLEICHEIKCREFTGEEQLECNKSKSICYRRAFKKRVAIWKELGISSEDKLKVVKSLESSEKKNQELYESILKEADYIKKILDEVKEIKKEIQSLHPTK